MLKQTEAATYRLAWAKKELATSRVEKVKTTSWRRVDCTRGCGKPLGMLMLYGGGWQDLESVSAALTLASKCSGATVVDAPPAEQSHALYGTVLGVDGGLLGSVEGMSPLNGGCHRDGCGCWRCPSWLGNTDAE